jgi:hypothetical protein
MYSLSNLYKKKLWLKKSLEKKRGCADLYMRTDPGSIVGWVCTYVYDPDPDLRRDVSFVKVLGVEVLLSPCTYSFVLMIV